MKHFSKDVATNYDKNIQALAPIYENLHFLIGALLSELPPAAHILSVGSGTGTELLKLAELFPLFSLQGVEPSSEMASVCQQRIANSPFANRINCTHGFIDKIPLEEKFDAALCLLVLHHTSEEERLRIISGVAARLKSQGVFIIAELSYDSATESRILQDWQAVVRWSGAPEEKVLQIAEMFKRHLTLLPPEHTQRLLIENGFREAIPFFQAALMRAWHCRKK